MIVRCALAAIDFNENIDRKPKLSADGKPRYKMKVGCSEFIINHKIFILKVDRSGSKVLISTETKLMKNFDETPEPHSYEVADTEKLLNDLRAVEESAKPLYIKLTVEISKIKEASKKSEQLKIAEGAWNQLQSKVSQLTRKGQEYKSKFTPAPAPTVPQPAQSHPRSAPLERLPLPIFSGAKADYLKFKQKFKNHVKYETEQEKLMALQSKCLSKDDDKKTVANEVTLKGCWEKLDYEYGDIARNRYSGKNCTRLTLNTELPKLMTKRIALKLNHTVFDPAMLIQPWILKLRLAFREILIYEKENDVCSWDAALPEKFRNDWLLLCEEMFELETLEFDRSLVPRGYDKTANPTLVIFSDGSDKGQCAVAYLVWKMKENEENVIKLVTSRTKIASMTKMTTPRSELTAAQLQTRLKVWLLKILNIKIEKTIHIVDASIILGMITNISLKFDTFSAPRVTEIQTNTKIESWFWVDTKQNPSDVGTRGKVTIKDLEVGSMWREGPDWLRGPFSTWPLRSDLETHCARFEERI